MGVVYFAYGSNLWPDRMSGRCPSAVVVGTGVLTGWRVRYAKPGRDGTAKLDVVEDASAEVHGAVYAIAPVDRAALDAAEPGYEPVEVPVATKRGRLSALTYRWPGSPTEAAPASWYVELAVRGARRHGLPEAYIAEALAV